jgi:hypothetical protein
MAHCAVSPLALPSTLANLATGIGGTVIGTIQKEAKPPNF